LVSDVKYIDFTVFENRVLRRIFCPKKDERIGVREKFVLRSFITRALRQI
jgi:hypothetical protein